MASASVSSRRNQLLEWFPFYVHRFVGDVRYRAMKDYHQAWFLNLLFASWVSERPGYLPDDGQLWCLANARTRQFFGPCKQPAKYFLNRCQFSKANPYHAQPTVGLHYRAVGG
jgi:hypothetical protein